ncbi:SDR family NAD(P)-dependent oxidoreductase [Terriglobus aquaticus]|uniref:SDR family NAD(P)-dependent oxidoreductase n=1 Tax=Terriglobus aquaticus TaxID=940139 RepID=A0ABW9KLQ4_9BACT|nr:SDR family oxidoreductase [Terriglobus aquaticus]
MAHRLLVFGASGAIGSAIVIAAAERGWHTVAVARTQPTVTGPGVTALTHDPFAEELAGSDLAAAGPFDAVCWAQGANVNDSIRTVDLARHEEVYRANCGYILVTLQGLLQAELLTAPAKLCVISSIWQTIARQNKLTYGMTKAALQGLVLSLAADLGAEGHLVNAVLPGALDTPMTRKNLTAEQIGVLESATLFGRLSTLEDVASAVLYLCSPENTGITGQFVAADLGFSRVRIL